MNGIEVPRDIALAGMDGTIISALSIPSITTISQPFGDMAKKAVEILLDLNQKSNSKIKFDPILLPRESTEKQIIH